ncbi:hypothetical protein C0214_18410 [Methylobacterium sp. DM1]|nr:hypothetical protein C0214_18410 [Methylobacterium sp. DM1]
MAQAYIKKYNVIICLGLYRSASTWMFNVIKSVVNLNFSIASAYADKFSDLDGYLKDENEFFLIKTHSPDISFQNFMKYSNAKIIITIREPLDCVASLMRQFDLSFGDALERVDRSSLSILEIKSLLDNTVFIYEKPESRNLDTVRAIADLLKVSASDEQCKAIAQNFSSENVRNYIDELTEEKYFSDDAPVDQFHAETHWHPRHVGEGVPGLYGEVLSEKQIYTVRHTCKKFREYFGYHLQDEIPAVRSGSTISFDSNGLQYCLNGFSRAEDWGIWTDGECALLRLPLEKFSSIIRVQMWCALSPAMKLDDEIFLDIMLNECRIFDLKAAESNITPLYISAFANIEKACKLDIRIAFQNLKSNNTIGDKYDARKLGIGLMKLQIEYQ